MAKAKAKAPARRRARTPARRKGTTDHRRRWMLAGIVVVLLLMRLLAFDGYRIAASSMEDSLQEGDVVFVERLSYGGDWLPDLSTPSAGDVIVFRRPESDGVMIKRCVATAGQRVEIRNKILYVDGERSPDPPRSKYLDAAILPAADGPRDHYGPFVVPPGHVFVLGDNRDVSQDSRFFGPIAQPLLVGRVIGVMWPRFRLGVN